MTKAQLAIGAAVAIWIAASAAPCVHARDDGGYAATAEKTDKPTKPPPDKPDTPKGATEPKGTTQPTKGGVSNPCLENPKLPDCPKVKQIH
jgi:hypothetical protein